MLSTQRTLLLLSILAMLMSAAWAQELTKQGKNKASAAAATVSGSGTAGRISKWTGVSGSNTYVLGNSNIFEDKFGKVGIGTDAPTSLLTVQGMIETTLGGYKFPDGTVQTTAGVAPNDVVQSLNGLKGDLLLAGGANITITPAGNTITVAAPNVLTRVAHDNTLTGEGTAASPLSAVSSDSLIQPFAVTRGFSVEPGSRGAHGVLTSVPTGKRLVIEQASVHCELQLGQRALRLYIETSASPNVFASHELVPVFTGEDSNLSFATGSAAMKLYAHSATDVSIFALRNFTTGGALCTFSISGFFVDLPPQN